MTDDDLKRHAADVLGWKPDREDWKLISIGAIYIVAVGIFITIMLAVSS